MLPQILHWGVCNMQWHFQQMHMGELPVDSFVGMVETTLLPWGSSLLVPISHPTTSPWFVFWKSLNSALSSSLQGHLSLSHVGVLVVALNLNACPWWFPPAWPHSTLLRELSSHRSPWALGLSRVLLWSEPSCPLGFISCPLSAVFCPQSMLSYSGLFPSVGAIHFSLHHLLFLRT